MDRYAALEERTGRQVTLPQTYVFSGDGEILMRLVGDQKSKKRTLSEELDQLLKEPPAGGPGP